MLYLLFPVGHTTTTTPTPLYNDNIPHHYHAVRRALTFHTCTVKGSAYEKTPIIIESQHDVHNNLVYVASAKSGSSSIRTVMCNGSCKASKFTNNSSRKYWFTVVRDPVKRFVSAFWETNRNEFDRTHKNMPTENLTAIAYSWVQDTMKNVITTKCFNANLAGQYASIISASNRYKRKIDYIGTLDTIAEDWDILALSQPQTARLHWPHMPHMRQAKNKHILIFNRSHLSTHDIQYLCQVYISDYCCFNLPFPQECSNMTCTHT